VLDAGPTEESRSGAVNRYVATTTFASIAPEFVIGVEANPSMNADSETMRSRAPFEHRRRAFSILLP